MKLPGRIASRTIAVAAGALALAGLAMPVAAQVHEHGGGGVHELQLDRGKRWATDAPLRQGMDEMRRLVVNARPAIRQGKLTREEYSALGAKVQEQVGYIVANCKLEARADETLHVILAEIVSGADAMQGKDGTPGPRAGANKVIAALGDYGRVFDHPGWNRP